MNNKIVEKDFLLGDRWFYFKLYTGVKTADNILVEIIEPLANQLIDNNLIKKWFFIRYSDPDYHLRIRFDITDFQRFSEIILPLNLGIKPYLEQRIISKFQTDTYSRELERYGTNTIEDAEELFFYDSIMTLKMLNLIEGDEGEVYRWHFACLALNNLMEDFSLSETEKFDLMNRLQAGFGQEFGMNSNLKIQLDNQFRMERNTIKQLLLKENEFYLPFYEIIDEKAKNTSHIIEKIKDFHSKNMLEVDYYSLLGSFIHMMLNRIFKSKQRLNEMAVYSLLFRFYRSEIARKKKAS